MKLSRLFVMATLTLPLMGSKCKETPEPLTPPSLEGAWSWSCESTPAPLETLVANPTCASQVPANSPFLGYVKESVEFGKPVQGTTLTSLNAFFAFGTCVDQQSSQYSYTTDETNKTFQLSIYDMQGALQQEYTVEKLNETERLLKQNGRECTLKATTAPTVKSGPHPRPMAKIDWTLQTNSSLMNWSTAAAFPFVYETPQLQSNGNSPLASFRVGYSILHTAIDGSQLEHYAAVVQLYDRVSGALLGVSEAQDLAPGGTLTLEYTTASGEDYTLSAVFN